MCNASETVKNLADAAAAAEDSNIVASGLANLECEDGVDEAVELNQLSVCDVSDKGATAVTITITVSPHQAVLSLIFFYVVFLILILFKLKYFNIIKLI